MAELAGDLTYVEGLMAGSCKRADRNIRHMTSDAALGEAERVGRQNRLVLVLAVTGALFLPVSTVAAVFGMAGDWAPDGGHFPLFWAVCGSITVVLMLLLVVMVWWNAIAEWVGRVRRKERKGYEAMV